MFVFIIQASLPRSEPYFSMAAQEIQFDHRIDSDPIGFYLISIKPMKSSWYHSHRTTFGSVVLESYRIRVSELDGVQCNIVTDSIGGSKGYLVQK